MEPGTQPALNSCAPWKASDAGVWALHTAAGVSTTVITTIINAQDRFRFLMARASRTRAVALFVVCLSPWKASPTGCASLFDSPRHRRRLGRLGAPSGALGAGAQRSGPCSVLRASASHWSLTKPGGGLHGSHFLEEETEAQKGGGHLFSGNSEKKATELRSEPSPPRCPGSWPRCYLVPPGHAVLWDQR